MSVSKRYFNAKISYKRQRILLHGTVQGVGFRPFVYRHAVRFGLAGWVANSPQGIIVEVQGQDVGVDGFIEALREPPPNALVTDIEVQEIPPSDDKVFVVRQSETMGACRTQVVPDTATCDECLSELFDPNNRRYRYPFINCVSCGPRYSIVESLPYDRERTSMRSFSMCTACSLEYRDSADRRFHAEPNACPECGPQIELWDREGKILARRDDAVCFAANALREGQIAAVKGVGGFHLMVDAGNEIAVQRLRIAKGREAKPLAVMFPTLNNIRDFCKVSEAEAELLCGPARPIVLLQKNGGRIAPAVTAGNARIGALLPYSPLHHLLLNDVNMPVVATSGNFSDEPIICDEARALERLSGVADVFLVHNRPIVRPLDDSVTQVVLNEAQILRRARGYAPAPVTAARLASGILALGGHLKASVAVTCEAGVVLSQHLGDLHTPAARDAYAIARADVVRLFAARPRLVVRDLHPDYATSQTAGATGLPIAGVQHHVAHVAACMAEHALVPPVLGVAWDGLGYGADGTIWGGEFLAIEQSGWKRAAHLRPFHLVGGNAAIREPARSALGLLFEVFGEDALDMTDLAPVSHFNTAERTVLLGMLQRGINAPLTTSAGRLFDAFAALCRLCQRADYEGEAASVLEWSSQKVTAGDGNFYLPLQRTDAACWQVDWGPALRQTIAELRAGRSVGTLSAKLHTALANAIAEVSQRLGAKRVVLTGGCFQNSLLTEQTVCALHAVGCQPFWHRRVPPNDGGIALGQVAWAAWSEQKEQAPCA